MDPFAAALDALFNAPGSAAAVYIPEFGYPRDIRVIERQRIGTEGTVRPRPVSLGKIFDIRVSDVAQPQVGEIIFLNEKVLTLTLPPEIDAEGMTWVCDLPELERTLEVLAPARLPDPHGDPEDTFAVAMTLAAARLDRSGTEGDQAEIAQVEAWRQATFFVPWTEQAAAITPAYRLREGGRTFDIQTVAEVGMQSAIEITGLAKVA